MMFIPTDSKGNSARIVRASSFRASFAFAAALLIPLLSIGGLQAAPINYGSFSGLTVDYDNVMEDSNSGDALPLFGEPTVSGDSLDFDPVGFSASSSGGGADITDANLAFEINAKPGHAIQNVLLNESGDTTLAGFGDNGTLTSVTADGVLNIFEVDGVGVALPGIPISLTFNPSGGMYQLGNLGGGPFFHAQWSGSLFLDIIDILNTHNVPVTFGATRISLNIDNTLTAVSQDGTSSLIAKKDFGGVSVTVNVPEPSSAVVALALMGLVTGFVRRGRRVS